MPIRTEDRRFCDFIRSGSGVLGFVGVFFIDWYGEEGNPVKAEAAMVDTFPRRETTFPLPSG